MQCLVVAGFLREVCWNFDA